MVKKLGLMLFLTFNASMTLKSMNCGLIKDAGNPQRGPGLQLGYAKPGTLMFELGANYYWSFARNYEKHGDQGNPRWDEISTFGPFANAIYFNREKKSGYQIGFNYHQGLVLSPRFDISAMNCGGGDWRFCLNAGISLFGFYFYAGVLQPIGKKENTNILRKQLGIKFIFNSANAGFFPRIS